LSLPKRDSDIVGWHKIAKRSGLERSLYVPKRKSRLRTGQLLGQ
jgi:hypothetical protein